MKNTLFAIMLTFCMCVSFAAAAEEESAEKKKPVPKADPSAAIHSILELPVIKGWKESVAAQGNDVSLVLWGQDIQVVDGHDCWGINVGKNNGDDTHLWKRFYVAKDGTGIWVESASPDHADETTYLTYDEWVNKCHPTADGLGDC